MNNKPNSIRKTIDKKYHRFIPNSNSIKKITKLNYKMAKASYEMTDQIKALIILALVIVLVLLFYFLIYKKHSNTQHRTFLNTKRKGTLVPYDFSKELKLKSKGKSTPETSGHIPSQMLNMSFGNNAFAISFWIKIDNSQDNWVHLLSYTDIQSCSNSGTQSSFGPSCQQYPGFWLSPKSNRISVYLDSKNNTNNTREVITIEDVPIRKWINVACVIDNQSVGLYVDGKLSTSYVISGHALQLYNTGSIYINQNTPLLKKDNIQMALLRVYSSYLNPQKIHNLYTQFESDINDYNKDKFDKLKYKAVVPFTEQDEHVKTDMEYIEDNDNFYYTTSNF